MMNWRVLCGVVITTVLVDFWRPTSQEVMVSECYTIGAIPYLGICQIIRQVYYDTESWIYYLKKCLSQCNLKQSCEYWGQFSLIIFDRCDIVINETMNLCLDSCTIRTEGKKKCSLFWSTKEIFNHQFKALYTLEQLINHEHRQYFLLLWGI